MTPSREGLQLLLSRWGYAAETAVDGADALHHAVTRHPALIITDLHMPKMDGLELLRTVQASLKLDGWLSATSGNPWT
jgi:CheY-like chemotaxis protein